ncbi:MAG: hypothetical protein GY729_20435, partial [Desulfobacteraceae bacterium]|nr:hypothetical protein [Desulfobacteraceae bacterium]
MICNYKSFAKLNLFLYVTGKRQNGFHELFSLMTRIDLYDDLQMSFTTDEISVSCDHPDVPEDESNLAHMAAAVFMDFLAKSNRTKIAKGLWIKI